jgi:hypothetical protein
VWPDVQELPVLSANQFLSQLSPGPNGLPEEMLLTIGYAAPPVLLGTPEEQQMTLRALGAVPVRAHVRVAINRVRLQEVIQMLQTTAETWDNATGGGR